MKLYFLSAQPCILTLNGTYFGRTDTFERFIEISASDNVYAKFSPQGSGDIGFFINEDLRFSPPDGCDVYLLRDGVAVYAHTFPPNDFTLQTIAQARFDDVLVTVYKQGAYQLCINTPSGMFNAALPPSFARCQVLSFGNLLLLDGATAIAVFNKNAECLLRENVLSYTIEHDTLFAVLPLSDRLGRTADCAWQIIENRLSQTKFCIRQDGSSATDLSTELLPYAFFESVLIGAEYTAFLSDELIHKAQALKEFLGSFQSVVLTERTDVCGLVYQKAERLYQVRYFTVKVENGKITDVVG